MNRSDEESSRALGLPIRQPIQLLLDHIKWKHEQVNHRAARESEREESSRELHGAIIRGNAHRQGIR